MPRRVVLLIGMGVGDPESLTHAASRALASADVLFTVDKGEAKADLNALRARVCAAYAGPGLRVVEVDEPERDRAPADYQAEVRRWHAARAAVWAKALLTELDEGGRGAFLVWGDPALYDSSLRILDDIRERGLVDVDVQVVPGISSVQALTARHRIPLNTVGGSVHITTGRRLAAEAAGLDSVVVMLDGAAAWQGLDAADWDIYWGAYLGGDDEIALAGPLAELSARIAAVKREARARKGWIMDVYLLRRRR
ncbi:MULTISPECIES: precorrin-6A synthase (deacetylating) [Pseudofrankia]|uniref:precorrin-6A synthase (deacetylating) n=1 Tax=Pseudofrankia TaxID=2994363 RepID=UPI000234BB00|nr:MULTISPECIES: precorrin-6A synthase (deacetylating) [Pseudofrankia]